MDKPESNTASGRCSEHVSLDLADVADILFFNFQIEVARIHSASAASWHATACRLRPSQGHVYRTPTQFRDCSPFDCLSVASSSRSDDPVCSCATSITLGQSTVNFLLNCVRAGNCDWRDVKEIRFENAAYHDVNTGCARACLRGAVWFACT